MTDTRPFKIYKIKTPNGFWVEAERTRDTWNYTTGGFVAYDNEIKNYMLTYVCENRECLFYGHLFDAEYLDGVNSHLLCPHCNFQMINLQDC